MIYLFIFLVLFNIQYVTCLQDCASAYGTCVPSVNCTTPISEGVCPQKLTCCSVSYSCSSFSPRASVASCEACTANPCRACFTASGVYASCTTTAGKCAANNAGLCPVQAAPATLPPEVRPTPFPLGNAPSFPSASPKPTVTTPKPAPSTKPTPFSAMFMPMTSSPTTKPTSTVTTTTTTTSSQTSTTSVQSTTSEISKSTNSKTISKQASTTILDELQTIDINESNNIQSNLNNSKETNSNSTLIIAVACVGGAVCCGLICLAVALIVRKSQSETTEISTAQNESNLPIPPMNGSTISSFDTTSSQNSMEPMTQGYAPTPSDQMITAGYSSAMPSDQYTIGDFQS